MDEAARAGRDAGIRVPGVVSRRDSFEALDPMPDQTTQQAAPVKAGATPSAGRATREQFLAHVLSAQCELAPAEAGAVLRLKKADTVQMMAVHPPLQKEDVAPAWLSKSADLVPAVVQSRQTQIASFANPDGLYGQTPHSYLVLIPVLHVEGQAEVAAFHIRAAEPADAVTARERLELTAALLGYYDMQTALRQRSASLARMRTAMEIVAQVSEYEKFRAAAMALCNETAARWSAQRVSLGILRGRYVKLAAISHTDRFSRKMRLVQDLESTMEECLDQDIEVIHPAPSEAGYVSRAAAQCSMHHGPATICSLPIRREGTVQAVLTVEREPDKPFTPAEVETMRLMADLVSGWILHLHDTDRWAGARLATNLKRTASAAVGPRHTWAKLTVAALLAAVLFLTCAKGMNRVEAPFEVQPPRMQAVVAPFDARLKAVYVKPNDMVTAGETLLAEFDVTDLELERIALMAEQDGYLKEHSAALAENKSAEAAIAKARADMLGARMRLIANQIEQARIIAPISGMVLSGDLERRINGQFERGAVMFELAPLHAAEAELAVPENRIGDLINEMDRRLAELREQHADTSMQELVALVKQRGQAVPAEASREELLQRLVEPLRGELATAANPGVYIPFEIYRIDSVAQVVGQRNVFKVHARLTGDEQTIASLKKGMQGVARIDIDRQPYIRIWTRDVVDWIRMRLWI